jgi:hypothetical protein
MPLPDLTVFCVRLAPGERLCVTFPGGATVCAPFSDARIPSPDELMSALLGPVNAALAPLTPIFNVIDVLAAVVNCVEAMEKALGPPPDPSKLAKCLPDLAKKLAKLLKLVPQLSIPVLIGGLLDVLIAYLIGLRAQLLTLIRQEIRILRAQTRALAIGSVALRTVSDCASGDVDNYLVNMNANAQPIGRLILVINALLELAGLEPLPTPADLGADAQKALAPLDEAISILQTVRQGFP